ncbi:MULTISPECIES: hypothetical protein [Bacillaceae]|uniref:hypothetical protein n=1 Tax=Bacillaceae TaxID=186817 RepID=UPI001E55306A|nr:MULTISPECIES: hypothetical protein [Bacillaceae]MCE4049624.1 hypothetical protein [Bacillus sp. Au-Bac7]MCM3031795.1 hypothetical protein [Niallia sp. MER 6]MDL0437004.1 hypothetical protein [Niallia sp. SS-2023]UPO87394.1 hypothetical protein L8T27_017850 [Niallia sp. Man26]
MNTKWLNVISLFLFLAAITYKVIGHHTMNAAGVIIVLLFIVLNIAALMKKDAT